MELLSGSAPPRGIQWRMIQTQTQTHAQTHTHTQTQTHAHRHTQRHTQRHIQRRTQSERHTQTHTHRLIWYAHPSITAFRAAAETSAAPHTNTDTDTETQTQTHTQTQTQTQTHTHTHRRRHMYPASLPPAMPDGRTHLPCRMGTLTQDIQQSSSLSSSNAISQSGSP